MVGVAWQSNAAAVTDRHSLLYSVIAGEEVIEGPLDPSAYASTGGPGVGGARLAALDTTSGIDFISFDDPEVSALGGNAIVAVSGPEVPEPATDDQPQRRQVRIYEVQEGDTVSSIAAQFGISENTVLWANGLSAKSSLTEGDRLTILPITGVLHTVTAGDTLFGLAMTYDADLDEILNYNGLAEGVVLSIGQKIIVPDGYKKPVKATPAATSGNRFALGEAPPALNLTGEGCALPTRNIRFSQYFRWGHTGVDMDDRSRPPLYASLSGTVKFAGWLGGYGNLIVLQHGNGVTTYYAHLDKFYVSEGQAVAKGESIGQMGSTGRSTGPHVHFEYRVGGRPVNPLQYCS